MFFNYSRANMRFAFNVDNYDPFIVCPPQPQPKGINMIAMVYQTIFESIEIATTTLDVHDSGDQRHNLGSRWNA